MLPRARAVPRATDAGLIATIVIGLSIAACGPASRSTSSAEASPSVVAVEAPVQNLPSSTASGETAREETVMTESPSLAPFTISSKSFGDGDAIPARFSCHGQDISPALRWSGVPQGASSLVLLVDDPDGRDWVHWTVLDLPAGDGELPDGVDPAADHPRQGQNDFHKVGYGGPCPPSGTHHYRFTLYALAQPLGLAGHPDGAAVRRALAAAQIVGQARLTGTFRA
ncbi:MAG TPA: YbhB/YbcL family Raf kinase inhibitor-like protein [Candidatus Limnocylindrales bacterium]|jgi:Raf kinase inhibitor-like YbhB/YbcL family protein|nr:YbhB/YbcL family Raf kinase inhibitor-like protein [Candidatus Limnocylindrales bacterium]